jgi:hypothetical protein
MERIGKRQRGNEAEKYKLEYIEDLSKAHQTSFEDLGLNYIEIQWNQDHQLDNQGLIQDCVLETIIQEILKVGQQCLH